MSTIGIKELAEIAGVSIATASRAISNPGRVSDTTREKVLKAAKKVGYTPNRLGAGLRTSKTGNIIVIIPDVSDSFNSGAINSLERAASNHGYSVLLGDTQGLRDRELVYGEMVKSRQADGIILFSYRLPFDAQTLALDDFTMPPLVNACEWVGLDSIPYVAIDDKRAAKEATQHLLDLGHKDIAVITGDISTPSSKARLAGFHEALIEAKVQLPSECFIQQGGYTVALGEECAEKLLLLKKRPTAVFCFSDEIALGCLFAFKANGFNVPKDISVIGFDDIRFAKYFDPPLTTISQPVSDIGKHCIDMLVGIINEKTIVQKSLLLPHKLVVRQSTGPCPQVSRS